MHLPSPIARVAVVIGATSTFHLRIAMAAAELRKARVKCEMSRRHRRRI